MADYLAAQITIGGCIPRRLVPRLCKAIHDEGLALEWGDAHLDPQSTAELLTARQLVDGELVLRLCDDHARYGEFEALEAFLVKHRIPYDRNSDSHYEYNASLLAYRPERGSQQWWATTTGQPLVLATPLWDVSDELHCLGRSVRSGSRQVAFERLQTVLKQLRAALPPRPTPLPAFEIGKSVGLRKAA